MTRLATLAVLLVLAGCAASLQTRANPENSLENPAQWASWCGASDSVRLRHDGLLTDGGRAWPLSSFMALDPATATVNVVVMNALGIKLATMSVTPAAVVIKQGPPPGFPVRFIEMYGLAVRRMFLLSWPCLLHGFVGETSNVFVRTTPDGSVAGHFYPGTRVVQTLEVRSNWEHWILERQGTFAEQGGELPEVLILKDIKAGLSLTLRLVHENTAD